MLPIEAESQLYLIFHFRQEYIRVLLENLVAELVVPVIPEVLPIGFRVAIWRRNAILDRTQFPCCPAEFSAASQQKIKTGAASVHLLELDVVEQVVELATLLFLSIFRFYFYFIPFSQS